MPRHLISGAHEWINEILTVPIYYLAKLQPRDLGRSMGKGGPVELDSPFKVEHFWCKIGRIKQVTVSYHISDDTALCQC